MDALCLMASIYELRDKASKVIFRAGNYRSTLDINLLERLFDVREKILEIQVSCWRSHRSLSKAFMVPAGPS